MLRIGQHLRHFQLAGFRQPAVKNFEKEIALEIDEDRLGILVAAFGAAAAESLFARSNVDVARPAFRGAQALHRGDEISRDAGVISCRQLLQTHRPRTPLHDHFPATETRRLRGASEQKRMEPKRDRPAARK
jgi:hypothetical protein